MGPGFNSRYGFLNPCSLSQVFSGFSDILLLLILGRVWIDQHTPSPKGERGAVVLKGDVTIYMLDRIVSINITSCIPK